MAFDTYAGLLQEIEDIIDRPDLSAKFDGWIRLAEAHIRRECKGLEREIRSQASIAAGQRYLALPTDYRGMRNLSIEPDGNHGALRQRSPAILDDLKERDGSGLQGTPLYFAVHGNEIEVYPVPGGAVEFEMTYTQALTPIDTGVGNPIFDEHPDIYFYGALVHSAPYLIEDERIPVWKGLRDEAIESYNRDAESKRYGAAPLTMAPTATLRRSR